jgi:hypothetical protein
MLMEESLAEMSGRIPYGLTQAQWEQLHQKTELKYSEEYSDNYLELLSISNGGFETGDFSNWIIQDLFNPFFPLLVEEAGVNVWTGFFSSSPTEGEYAAIHGFDGDGPGSILIEQNVTVPANALSLEFDYRAAWDLLSFGAALNRYFVVNIKPAGGGMPLQSDTILVAPAGSLVNDTGNRVGSVDISNYANSNIRIGFEWVITESFTGPAFFQIDNIFIIPVEPGAQIAVTPESVDFGVTEVGTSSDPSHITIRSVGDNNLTVNSITLSGGDFSISNGPSLPISLQPGDTTGFDITFSPAATGFQSELITISSNDASNPAIDITIEGEGLEIMPAFPYLIYGSTGFNDGGRLIVIDPASAVTKVIGQTGLAAVPGLAINSGGYIFGTNGSNIYRIDAMTGKVLWTSSSGLNSLPAVAFDSNDILYGLGFDPISFLWNLYIIDPFSGDTTIIGQAGVSTEWRGMAFDPISGTLWASTNNGDIYTIDHLTGAPTFIGSTGLMAGVPDISFDPAGNLYGVSGGSAGDNDLISINKITGAGTIIGNTGIISISGLAQNLQSLTGPQIGIIPGAVNFGPVYAGSNSNPAVIQIFNIGDTDLTVNSIAGGNTTFRLSNIPILPLTIPAGASADFEASFTPQTTGFFSAFLAISSNDPDNPVINILLEGEGAPPPIGTLFASTSARSDTLITIDPVTGSGTPIGFIGNFGGITEIEFRHDGVLFGSTGGGNSAIVTINPITGEPSLIGYHDFGAINGLEFSDSGILYGTYIPEPDDSSQLVEVNTNDASITYIGFTGYRNIGGLAFSPTGTLFGITSGSLGGELLTIDTQTGAATLVGNTGYSSIGSLEFSPNGTLYAGLGQNDTLNAGALITIDPATANATLVGFSGFQSISGLSFFPEIPLSIEEPKIFSVPSNFQLSQNYPNPFNPTTHISWQLPAKSPVKLTVYTITGQKVATLVDEVRQAGYHSMTWNAAGLASGVYLYRLETDGNSQIRKMILMK